MTGERRAEEDLRATRDAIDVDAERLSDLEDEKGRLDPRDPRVAEMSKDAVEIASRVHRATIAEQHLTDEIQRQDPPRRPD
jgi:hypothetical protein